MARQNCCCDTKLAIAGLQNTVQTEACADRNAITDVNGVPQPMRRFNFEEHIPQSIASEQPVSRKEFDELRKAIKELKELIE